MSVCSAIYVGIAPKILVGASLIYTRSSVVKKVIYEFAVRYQSFRLNLFLIKTTSDTFSIIFNKYFCENV